MSHPEVDSWRQDYRHREQPAASECASDETLAALAVGELAGPERTATVDHLIRCRRCSDSYATLRDLDREATAGQRRRWFTHPALAAGVAVALLAAALVWLPTSGPGRDADEPTRGTVRGTEQQVTPADGIELAAPPARLTWPAQTGATAYRVELYDAEAELLWRSEPSGEPAIDLADDGGVLPLPPGAYYWVVEVEGPVARSRLGPYWFLLTRQP